MHTPSRHKTKARIRLWAASVCAVALAAEISVCAAMAMNTWAWTSIQGDAQNITATYNGTSIMWSGAVVDSTGRATFNLFAQTYVQSGVVGVQSLDKSAVIAPGTYADTTVTFTNASDESVTIKSLVQRQATVTLKSGTTYSIEAFKQEIFDSAAFSEGVVTTDTYDNGEFSATDTKNVYAATTTVAPHSSVTGKITWGWPIDGYDTEDTQYGNAAADDDPIKVTVSLDIQVEDKTGEGGDITYENASGLVQTGDTAPIIALAVAGAITLSAFIALTKKRKVRKH